MPPDLRPLGGLAKPRLDCAPQSLRSAQDDGLVVLRTGARYAATFILTKPRQCPLKTRTG